MSDPQRPKDDHPRRAEPLQPDKPGSGRQGESAGAGDEDPSSRTVRRQQEQSKTALDNVRNDT